MDIRPSPTSKKLFRGDFVISNFRNHEYKWADERLMADRAFVDAFYSAPDVMWIIDRVTGLGGLTFPEFYFGIWRDASAPNNSYGLQEAVDFADTIAGHGRQRRLRLRVCR